MEVSSYPASAVVEKGTGKPTVACYLVKKTNTAETMGNRGGLNDATWPASKQGHRKEEGNGKHISMKNYPEKSDVFETLRFVFSPKRHPGTKGGRKDFRAGKISVGDDQEKKKPKKGLQLKRGHGQERWKCSPRGVEKKINVLNNVLATMERRGSDAAVYYTVPGVDLGGKIRAPNKILEDTANPPRANAKFTR